LKFEISMWSIWNLKIWTKMSKFGCVNISNWKLKTWICNLFVKCLEGIWKFEIWNVWILKTENKNVWILKIEMSKYWNVWKMKNENDNVWLLKCLNIENWNVSIMKIENWNVWVPEIKIWNFYMKCLKF
jgi:hypothetical protein